MNKTLIKNESEYRNYAFKILKKFPDNDAVEDALGVIICYECWDTVDGVDLDESGNPIPDDFSSPEQLVLEQPIEEFTYPFIVLDWIEVTGDVSIVCVEFVELKDFNE
jgi:hypothetical protein